MQKFNIDDYVKAKIRVYPFGEFPLKDSTGRVVAVETGHADDDEACGWDEEVWDAGPWEPGHPQYDDVDILYVVEAAEPQGQRYEVRQIDTVRAAEPNAHLQGELAL